jgi:hypothetical protein
MGTHARERAPAFVSRACLPSDETRDRTAVRPLIQAGNLARMSPTT